MGVKFYCVLLPAFAATLFVGCANKRPTVATLPSSSAVAGATIRSIEFRPTLPPLTGTELLAELRSIGVAVQGKYDPKKLPESRALIERLYAERGVAKVEVRASAEAQPPRAVLLIFELKSR
jgi:hypothetical protein